MNTGKTLKQIDRDEFFEALAEYRTALVSGSSDDIVRASVRVHIAKGRVTPKNLARLVGRTFRETRRQPHSGSLSVAG